ncbi:hypothetical protein ACQR35_03410 [Pseudarthrobacter sp. J1738]|uniref:hypothetical protein n=1 Tax=unclassified Pseudarthrobacter TaxID=2647000 RepID=UPI003D2CADE6
MTSASALSATEAVKRPWTIGVISIILVLEALALLLAAAWYGYNLVTGAPVLSFWGAVFTLGLILAAAIGLLVVGHFLFRGQRWTRSAALVMQLFVLTIGVPTLTGGLPLLGLAMIIPAVVVIVLLFFKDTVSFASRSGGSTPSF